MKKIEFKSYEFNAKNVQGEVTCPKEVIARMLEEVLVRTPEDAEVKEYANTTSVIRGNKKINVSAWQFALADWPDGRPFNYFTKDGSELIIVWGVTFVEDGKFVNNGLTEYKYAVGFPSLETNASEYRRSMWAIPGMAGRGVGEYRRLIRGFFADKNDVLEALAEHLPDGAEITFRDPITLKFKMKYKDYDLYFSFNGEKNNLFAEIERHWSEYERVYGMSFVNYSSETKINSVEEVENFDWKSFIEDLYEHKHGIKTHGGYSLGT